MTTTTWRAAATMAVGCLALLLAGCAAPIAAEILPTTTSSTATAAASAAPAATSLALTASDASAATSGAPTNQAQAAPVSDGSVVLTLAAESSKASYHATEQLAGHSLPNEAVGTTPAVAGKILLAADGSIVADQSAITVDLRLLQSDESRRDGYIQRNTLQTDQYPIATFVPRSVQGLSLPLPTEGTTTFQLSGDLTLHGVTRPVTWQVTAQFGGQDVTGSAATSVQMTDFGMTPPKAGPVLSIQDQLGLQLDFLATSGAAVST